MACGDIKDLPRRTASCKYYLIDHLILLKVQGLVSMTYKFFDKKSATCADKFARDATHKGTKYG